MGLMLTILLILIIIFLGALLITAYIINPIVSWLIMNPLGGVVILIVIFFLTSIILIEEMRED